tara:strand:+ start:211 stop:657 length:447 start_codon:yes stop_codon:yes gene_type:complete
MAHFAELESKTDPTGFTSDTHLVVKRVVVIDNEHVTSDEHADGETWCASFFGSGTWKQTSYNNNFRKQFAGIGYVYNSTKNKFLEPQPYNSWSLNTDDDWEAPISYPSKTSDKQIRWDEDNLRWIATSESDSTNTYYWNPDNQDWVDI